MKNNKGSGKMDLEKTNNNSMIIKYQNTDNVLEDICYIRWISGLWYYIFCKWYRTVYI